MDKEFVEERVAYTVNKETEDSFVPRIYVSKTSDRSRGRVEKSFRPIEASDMARILDFDGVLDPPPDGPMMHGETDGINMAFPSRHFCIRGGFLFYFDLNDISSTGQSHYVEYHGPPIGVIPLDKVTISLPPGGRRVFREHAQTNARTGYELAILHDDGDGDRPPAFIVAQSLQLREKWANAIQARAPVESYTKLRAVLAYQDDPSQFTSRPQDMLKKSRQNQTPTSGGTKRTTRKGKRSVVAQNDELGAGSNDALVQEALVAFGKSGFNENAYTDRYFEKHTELDADDDCRRMEKWQQAIKKGLKTAVLEQYEYFVEASGEMTKMGKEVGDLKNMVETQVETIKEMKEIDFGLDPITDDEEDNASDADDMFKDERKGKNRRDISDDHSDASSVSFRGGEPMEKFEDGLKFREADSKEGVIDIPSFLEDSTEEIVAYVKESRYTDATDLWAKAKQEVTAIIQLVRIEAACLFSLYFPLAHHFRSSFFLQHETPTDNYLTKKQFTQVRALIASLDDLAEMISNRLVENLRRKNEALKQASKRERSDPSANMVPSVSPCCLNDDLVSLRLLVKLGKTQDAATAYSARRSLLLLER
jgi:hypothetical protein